jgi:hypothetical protein
MPAKKTSQAKPQSAPATAESIHGDIQKALADARKKLKSAGVANVDAKLKLVDHCKRIIDDIWPC